MKLEWTPDLSTGDLNIDSQHRHIVRVLSQVRDISARRDKNREGLLTTLSDLGAFLDLHFLYEEKTLSRRAFPDRHQIKQEHQQLRQQLQDLLTFMRLERYPDSRPLTMFIYSLYSHLRGENEFALYLKEEGPRSGNSDLPPSALERLFAARQVEEHSG
jgi:hemerythrin-like metal-binding protein